MKIFHKTLLFVTIISLVLNTSTIGRASTQSYYQIPVQNLSPESFFKPIIGTTKMKDITLVRTLLTMRIQEILNDNDTLSVKDAVDHLRSLNPKFIDRSGFYPVHFFTDSAGIVTVGEKQMLHVKCRLADHKNGLTERSYHAIFLPTGLKENEGAIAVIDSDEYREVFKEDVCKLSFDSLLARDPESSEAIKRDRIHQIYDREVLRWAYNNEDVQKYKLEAFGLNPLDIVNSIMTAANVSIDLPENNPHNLKLPQDREITVIKITDAVKKRLDMYKLNIRVDDGRVFDISGYAHASNNSVTIFMTEKDIEILKGSPVNPDKTIEKLKAYLTHELGVMCGLPVLHCENIDGEVVPFNELDMDYRKGWQYLGEGQKPLMVQNLDINTYTRDYAMGIIKDDEHAETGSGSISQDREIKGSSASELSSVVSWELVRNGRIAEFVIEENKLHLIRMDSKPLSYDKGKTPRKDYLLDEKVGLLDINNEKSNNYISPKQQELMIKWIREQADPDDAGITAEPRIRIVLGDVSLRYKKKVETSYIAYWDFDDNVLYIGEKLFSYLFTDEGEGLRNFFSSRYSIGSGTPEYENMFALLEETLGKIYYAESELFIKKLSDRYEIDVDDKTNIAFHVMPEDKISGSGTYICNTAALRATKTVGGDAVNAALLPVAADAKNMDDAQRIIAYIRYNNRVMGMIPAAGFKDKVKHYLDDVSPLADLLGVDPVYKNANGTMLKGDLDLGNAPADWFEANHGDIAGRKFLVIGAGVTGMATAYELTRRGGRVYIAERDRGNISRAYNIWRNLLTKEQKGRLEILNEKTAKKDLTECIGEVDVIMNATGLGKEPHVEEAPPIEYTQVKNGQVWVDFNYRPKSTLFLEKVLKYSARTTATIDNGIDLTAYINASHMWFFLQSTQYQMTGNPVDDIDAVEKESLKKSSISIWRKELQENALTSQDRTPRYNERAMIQRWQSDGIPRDDLAMASKYGFEKVHGSIDFKGQTIDCYRIKYKENYAPPKLKVKSLNLVYGAETPISQMSESVIRGGEAEHIGDLVSLTGKGRAQVRLGARKLVDVLGERLLGEKIVFIVSGAPSAKETMEKQLKDTEEILLYNNGISGGFNFDKSKIDLKGKSIVLENPRIEDRFAGIWGGVNLHKIRLSFGGQREYEIAAAVLKGDDAFGRAIVPGSSGIQSENTIMAIKRAREFIDYINNTHADKDVVVYLNGFMTGILQVILAPELFRKDEYISLTNNKYMPKRGEPYDVLKAQEEAYAALKAFPEPKKKDLLKISPKNISEITERAYQAGLSIPAVGDNQYKLIVTEQFFLPNEFKNDVNRFKQYFKLESFNSDNDSSENIINTIINNNSGNEEKVVVLIENTTSEEELNKLMEAGIRYILVDQKDLIDGKIEASGAGEKKSKELKRIEFRDETYMTMLLARRIDESTEENSPIFKTLEYFIKSRFVSNEGDGYFSTPEKVREYINAIRNGDASRILTGYLASKRAEAYELPEYRNVVKVMMSA